MEPFTKDFSGASQLQPHWVLLFGGPLVTLARQELKLRQQSSMHLKSAMSSSIYICLPPRSKPVYTSGVLYRPLGNIIPKSSEIRIFYTYLPITMRSITLRARLGLQGRQWRFPCRVPILRGHVTDFFGSLLDTLLGSIQNSRGSHILFGMGTSGSSPGSSFPPGPLRGCRLARVQTGTSRVSAQRRVQVVNSQAATAILQHVPIAGSVGKRRFLVGFFRPFHRFFQQASLDCPWPRQIQREAS